MAISNLLPNTLAIASLTRTEIAALSTTDVVSLTASDLNSLSWQQLAGFTQAQIVVVSPGVLSTLTQGFVGLNRTEISELTTSQLASLTTAQVASLSAPKLDMLNASQIASLSAADFSALSRSKIDSLSTSQISALDSAQISTFDKRTLAGFSAAQIAAISSTAITAIGPARLASLSTTQAAALTSAQLSQFSTKQLDALENADLLTATQLQEIMAVHSTPALPLSSLDWFALSNLTSDQLAAVSTDSFSSISASNIAYLSPLAIPGVSVSQLRAMSSAQLEAFTPAQIAAMSAGQQAVLNTANPLLVQISNIVGGSSLTYNDALTFLQGVAASPLTEASFAQLQQVAGLVQSDTNIAINGFDDAIGAAPSVVQLFDGVVLGNAENNDYYGGSNQSAPIGNLSANSTSAQFDELIGKWFLGTDNPGLQTDTNGGVASATYQQTALPLFGTDAGPLMTDVVEGGVNDSSLLAGIAETALQDSAYLQSLITDNGNGTYSVALPSEFGTTYETVNGQLPLDSSGETAFATANSLTGSWVALLEKAAVQGAVDSSYALRNSSTTLGNTYAVLSLPYNADDQVNLYGGELMTGWNLNSYNESSNLSAANSVFESGLNVVLQVGTEYEAVTSINTTTGSIGVYDPGTGKESTVSATSLATDQSAALWYSGVSGRASVNV